MHGDSLVYAVFLIFTGAALLGTAALYARQSLLVSYIVGGALLGPWGLNLLGKTGEIQQASHIGVIFLLYLLGLNLHPQKLVQMLRQTTLVTILSSVAFAVVGIVVGWSFGFCIAECLLIGAAATFSSTILGL